MELVLTAVCFHPTAIRWPMNAGAKCRRFLAMFCNILNPLLTKVVRSRRLDVSLAFFSPFFGPRLYFDFISPLQNPIIFLETLYKNRSSFSVVQVVLYTPVVIERIHERKKKLSRLYRSKLVIATSQVNGAKFTTGTRNRGNSKGKLRRGLFWHSWFFSLNPNNYSTKIA